MHWSALIFGKHDGVYRQGFASEQTADATAGGYDKVFASTVGWEMFQCPAWTRAGWPPANTFAGNSDGLPNEAGPDVLDQQAPRLAYTANEALCPRSRLVAGFSGAVTPQHFVRAGPGPRQRRDDPGRRDVGRPVAEHDQSQVGGGTVSNSRRPVSAPLGHEPAAIASADKAYTVASAPS